MSYPDIPHLKFPVDFQGTTLQAVEQDSVDDVSQCVEIILRTPVGWRYDESEFGIHDPVFGQGDIDPDEIELAIVTWEPRADVEAIEQRDRIDTLIDHLTVNVRGATSG